MSSDTVLEMQDVVAKNGIIQAMGASGTVSWDGDALIIDGSGKYLMPGLAEMHAHLPPVKDLEPTKEVLMLFALNGVTTIRGMLGHPKHLELRSRIQNGEIFGPRLITAGPPLAGYEITTPEEAIAAVRAQKKEGYDFLKILTPPLSEECFAALAAAAHESGIPFAGHVPSTVGVYGAIEAGYWTIEHLDGFIESLVPGIKNRKQEEVGWFGLFVADEADTTGIPALIDALRDKQIWVTPTQSLAHRWFAPDPISGDLRSSPEMAYMSDAVLEDWMDKRARILKSPHYSASEAALFLQIRQRMIFECNKNGVGLLLGSDAPQVYNVPGFAIHQELQYLVDAGLTPYEALRTGTANIGLFFKREDLGLVRKGAVSDLILLNSNPLEDISNTSGIEGVLLGNRWMPKAFIGAALKQLKKR